MAPQGKVNYRSFDVQARLLRAIVASLPENQKFDYKEIVACYGSDMTEHALNHRFRKIRTQVKIVRAAREQGMDVQHLPTDHKAFPNSQDKIDHKNIAKYFGASTPDGIGFQFRSIKTDAKKMRQAVAKGEDVHDSIDLGSGASASTTPSRRAPKTPSTSGKKRSAKVMHTLKREESEGSDSEVDYDEVDETPTKKQKTTVPRRKSATPTRAAASKAGATVATQLKSDEDEDDIVTPVDLSMNTSQGLPPSIFGNGNGNCGDTLEDYQLAPSPYALFNNTPGGLDMFDESEI